MDVAGRPDQRRFIVPQAAVRLVIGDGAPHALGKPLFYPMETAFPLDRASHVHDNVPKGGVAFNAVPEPTVGRVRGHAKLQQMADGTTIAEGMWPHTCLLSATMCSAMPTYRMLQAFAIEAMGMSAVSTNRSQARRTRRGLRTSGWPSDAYTHSMARVRDETVCKTPVAVEMLLFWREVTDGDAPMAENP